MLTKEITLQKRTPKMLLYLAVAMPLTLMLIGLIMGMVFSFVWYHLILLLLLLFAIYLVFSALIQFFFYKNVKLLVESDGQTIKFYNKNADGKIFNESEVLKLDEMTRFYIVKTSTRYFMKNYSFSFEGKSPLASVFSDDVDCFPNLYECTGADRRDILDFVSNVAPNIEMGYETMWQRLKR
jgi:hypothetical protein